jgi:hypothetical protein
MESILSRAVTGISRWFDNVRDFAETIFGAFICATLGVAVGTGLLPLLVLSAAPKGVLQGWYGAGLALSLLVGCFILTFFTFLAWIALEIRKLRFRDRAQ